VITKRECRRRAHESRARGLNKRSQADRSDVDMHEQWALSDAAGIEFLKADQWQQLADGSWWDRWLWRDTP
jgi:hypothetical protein